jgi:hypothetical protein
MGAVLINRVTRFRGELTPRTVESKRGPEEQRAFRRAARAQVGFRDRLTEKDALRVQRSEVR